MNDKKRELVRQVRKSAMLAAGPAGLHEIENSGLNWMWISMALEYQDIRIAKLEAAIRKHRDAVEHWADCHGIEANQYDRELWSELPAPPKEVVK